MTTSDARLGRTLFTVTSALKAATGHSRFSDHERVAQTCATVTSIRAHVPQADIFIVDGSPERPEAKAVASLGACLAFTWYGDMPELRRVAAHPNPNVVKNASELILYSRLLGELIARNALDQYQRVFKLSGRYRLTERFALGLHLAPHAVDRFVFTRREAAGWRPEDVGTHHAWRTRLFSYDPSLAHLLGSLYHVALNDMECRLTRGIYTDIEHCLGRYLNPELVVEVDSIGVTGEVGLYEIHVDE